MTSGFRVFRLDETDSTNADARAGLPLDVYRAEFQRAGRGRLDHRWLAPRGANLTFSMVLGDGGRGPADVATLPLAVGLGIARALAPFVGGASDRVRLKWPNDVLVDGRKICGILCERAPTGVIAGIGVNVNQTDFPPELVRRATSLALLAGRPLDREAVFAALLAGVAEAHARWLKGGFAALQSDYAARDALKGKRLAVLATDGDTVPVSGLCGGVREDGALLVDGAPVFAGEAHILDCEALQS